jgi:hypothetical protein
MSGPDPPLLGCDFPLAEPGTTVHNELILSGWAVSPVGIASLAVEVGDRRLQASYGLDTPWVAETMPEMPGADRAGFHLRLDTASWPAQPARVAIRATDTAGHGAELAGEVSFLPYEPLRYSVADNLATIAAGRPVMWIEWPRLADVLPTASCPPLEVSGWAYSGAGIEAIEVTVDGRRAGRAVDSIVRPDLLADYGPEVAAAAGFSLRLEESALAEGVHRMAVVTIARDGRAVGIESNLTCGPIAAPGGSDPGPPQVDWMEARRAPQRHSADRSPSDPASEWEERALRAEAEAAANRTEANLAQMRQKAALEMLREAEARLPTHQREVGHDD